MFCVKNEEFVNVSGFRQNGINTENNKFWRFDFKDSFKDVWYVSIYHLDIKRMSDLYETTINLPTKLFSSASHVCQYLKERTKHHAIKWHCENDVLTLELTHKEIGIKLSDDVRDILALDHNIYYGPGTFKAGGPISLTRRINYLYVYSNIGEMIHIGDTEAPLLAVIPYNPKPCQLMTELNFKIPMYVTVNCDRISQIDIGIYDDAGKLIPFHRDAITSLQLHFRRK